MKVGKQRKTRKQEVDEKLKKIKIEIMKSVKRKM